MGEVVEKGSGRLKGKVLRAVTVYEEPYVMLKKDHEVRAGNDKFEGKSSFIEWKGPSVIACENVF